MDISSPTNLSVTVRHAQRRLVTLGYVLAVLAAVETACTNGRRSEPAVELRESDGAIWLRPAELHNYLCIDGRLVCDTGIGRLSLRRCRCAVP